MHVLYFSLIANLKNINFRGVLGIKNILSLTMQASSKLHKYFHCVFTSIEYTIVLRKHHV